MKLRRDEIPGLTPLRTWAPINDEAVIMPTAEQRAATAQREAERAARIEADWQRRQAKLIEQQAEARRRIDAMSQAEKVEALFPSDHFGD